LILGTNAIDSTPFFRAVGMVSNNLSALIFQVILEIHDFSEDVTRLRNINVVKRIGSYNGEMFRRGPFPVGNGFGKFNIFDFNFFRHIENLNYTSDIVV